MVANRKHVNSDESPAPTVNPRQRPVHLGRNTTQQLAEAFLHRIASREYAPGDFLPSCREVERELSVDKNTVLKAYKILEGQGVVEPVRGRGMRVVERPRHMSRDGTIRQEIDAVVWRARAFGVSQDEIWRLFGDSVWVFYESANLQVLFLECNEYETTRMASRLEEHLNLPVEPLMLQQFLPQAASYIASADVILTTFYHLPEVIAAAGPERDKVLGLYVTPVADDVRRIAEVENGAHVGLISSRDATIGPLVDLIRTYNTEVAITPHVVTDASSLPPSLQQYDYLVVTMSTYHLVVQLARDKPLIKVTFAVDEHSLDFLKSRVVEITTHRTLATARRGEPR